MTQEQQQQPSPWTDALLASAKRLRLGVEGQHNAEALEGLAAAIRAPNGYIVKVGGGLSLRPVRLHRRLRT